MKKSSNRRSNSSTEQNENGWLSAGSFAITSQGFIAPLKINETVDQRRRTPTSVYDDLSKLMTVRPTRLTGRIDNWSAFCDLQLIECMLKECGSVW